jgi:hypothetical protein
MDWPGFRLPAGAIDFPVPQKVRTPSPPCLLFDEHWTSFAWVQRVGRDAVHSPPSNPEFKNEWSYTSNPSYMASWR